MSHNKNMLLSGAVFFPSVGLSVLTFYLGLGPISAVFLIVGGGFAVVRFLVTTVVMTDEEIG